MRTLSGRIDWNRIAGTVIVAAVAIVFYSVAAAVCVWAVLEVAEALL